MKTVKMYFETLAYAYKLMFQSGKKIGVTCMLLSRALGYTLGVATRVIFFTPFQLLNPTKLKEVHAYINSSK